MSNIQLIDMQTIYKQSYYDQYTIQLIYNDKQLFLPQYICSFYYTNII